METIAEKMKTLREKGKIFCGYPDVKWVIKQYEDDPESLEDAPDAERRLECAKKILEIIPKELIEVGFDASEGYVYSVVEVYADDSVVVCVDNDWDIEVYCFFSADEAKNQLNWDVCGEEVE